MDEKDYLLMKQTAKRLNQAEVSNQYLVSFFVAKSGIMSSVDSV